MRFISMSAQNFMSFKSVAYTFPSSGLYFVGGEIADPKSASSNGAGKSAFFEILSWALFGQTVRSIKTDDIVNWAEGKNCRATVAWSEGEQEFTVMRCRGDKEHGNELFFSADGNDLRGAGIKETEQRIIDVLGMSWQTFSSAVIFGERARSFAEGTDAEKKRIFDEILQLQQYTEAQVRVKDDIKELKAKLAKSDYDIALAEQACVADEREAIVIEQALASLAEKKAQSAVEIAQLASERKQLEADTETAKAEHLQHAQDLAELQAQAKELVHQYRMIETEKNGKVLEASQGYSFNQMRKTLLTRQIEKVNNWLAGVEHMPQSERCPTCGQSVSETSVAEVLAHYAKDLDNQQAELGILSNELKKTESEITWVRGEYDVKLREIDGTKFLLEEQIQDSARKETQLRVSMSAAAGRVALIDQTVKHLVALSKAEEQPLLTRKAASQAYAAQHAAQKAAAVATKDQQMAELPLLEFWSEGFGNRGIKSLLLDEVVPVLNGRVSYYASSLLEENVSISFDTEATNKSGEVRDRFNIRIQIGDRVADYKQLSSGEKGRVDTAVLLSLQSLIFNRSIHGSNLVILDELFEHLDITGIERAVNLLREEAKDKAIFVISHQPEFADFFDNVVLVKKRDGISYLEM